MVQTDYVVFWRWDDAPEWATAYSTHGGDEEGVIWIPKRLQERDGDYPHQLEPIWRVYGPTPDFIQLNNGMLIIWAHA